MLGRGTLEGHAGSWLSALPACDLAKSPSLNLFLLCKMGSWYLAGFVTQIFRKACGVSGDGKGWLLLGFLLSSAQEVVG